MLFVIVAGILS